MTRTPLIGIGLPVYNGAATLERALQCHLGQDVEDLEVVVVDNASTDSTSEIARSYAATDRRVVYVRNERNVGLVGNFARALELTSGPYFKWSTHDDWIDPDYLSRTLAALQADPGAALACTGVAVHDGSGQVVERWDPGDLMSDRSALRRGHRQLWDRGETHQMFGLVRRDPLVRIGGMQAYLGAARVMLLELALSGPFLQLPGCGYHYTVDDSARAGRNYSVYNDPSSAGQLPLRTWRLTRHQLAAAGRHGLTGTERSTLRADVLVRAVRQDGRRLAAELYRSGQALARRRAPASVPAQRAGEPQAGSTTAAASSRSTA